MSSRFPGRERRSRGARGSRGRSRIRESRTSAGGSGGPSRSRAAPPGKELLEVRGGLRFVDRDFRESEGSDRPRHLVVRADREPQRAVRVGCRLEAFPGESRRGGREAGGWHADEPPAPCRLIAAKGLALRQAAAFDEYDPIAHLLDFRELVRVQDDRRAARLGFENPLADERDPARVGAGGGFVQEEKLGVTEERLGEPDPLEHPSRIAPERARESGPFQPDPIRCGLDLGLRPASGAAGEPPVERQKSAAGQVPIEAEPLGEIPRSRADREIVRGLSVDRDRTPVRPQKAEKTGQEGRLPRPVRSDQAERLSAADSQGDRVERLNAAGAEVSERFGHALDGDHLLFILREREYKPDSARFSTGRMIEVENLTKRFPTQVAVSDVSFSVREGEIVGFLGPNGAGKTTAMRVLTGFLPPTSGTARVAGYDVVTRSEQARASLGYLPESAALYPEMRVREYLAYRARLEGVRGAEVARRVREAIDSCLLEEVADRKVENLSKGFRQRAALAGALVHEPPVLILDEPTVGLDPAQIIKIREMIRGLGRQRAVLLSTHILPEVDAVCDRVLIIDRGRIVAEGTPRELRARLAGKPVVRAAFKGDVAVREAVGALAGAVAVEETSGDGETRVRVECSEGTDLSEEVFHLAVARGWVLRELTREGLSLEDVFVRLTRHDETSASAEATADQAASGNAPAPEEADPSAESASA